MHACLQAFLFQPGGPDGVLCAATTEVIHKLLLSKDPEALEKLESISPSHMKHFDANQLGSKVRRDA